MRADVPIDDPRFGRVERCACKRAEDAERRLRRLRELSGLTEAERTIRLSDIDMVGRPGADRMVESAQRFISSPSGFLTVWGKPGNAKTMVLMAIVNELTEIGIEAVYVTAFDMIGFIRQAFAADGGEDALSRLKRFEMVRVLAIDEFDKIKPTEWTLEQLTEIIDRRYRLGLSGCAGTVIAMNGDPRQQPEWIASRLLDGRNTVIRNDDSDLRKVLR